jgi:hypothetical protein
MDNDPELLLFYKQSTTIDEQLVKIYQEKGDNSPEWRTVKAQQKAIKNALKNYMLRALKIIDSDH